MILYYTSLYFLCGVVFNFLYDLLVGTMGLEEHRFTLLERIAVTLIWPAAVIIFLFYFIISFFTDNES